MTAMNVSQIMKVLTHNSGNTLAVASCSVICSSGKSLQLSHQCRNIFSPPWSVLNALFWLIQSLLILQVIVKNITTLWFRVCSQVNFKMMVVTYITLQSIGLVYLRNGFSPVVFALWTLKNNIKLNSFICDCFFFTFTFVMLALYYKKNLILLCLCYIYVIFIIDLILI